MINRKQLTKDQVFHAIETGEFDREVTASTGKTVVILTQDWCPQWKNMQSWIYGVETTKKIDIYELIYNKVDYHQEFMNFKENKWNNHEIPYLRFYEDGKLIDSSNYISQTEFKSILGI